MMVAKKYLVFCGVPKRDKFHDTPLLKSYFTMQPRAGVLSRDWCIAAAPLTEEQFSQFKEYFNDDKKADIEHFVLSDPDLLNNLTHYCTFIINNPVKKGAEKFIAQCNDIQLPIFVATGDTAKASENIAHVLLPKKNAGRIVTVHAAESNTINFETLLTETNLNTATIIFVGVTKNTLAMFKQVLALPAVERPAVIFSEMSTEGKGILTQFLKEEGFFVVANGDGTNDIMMMKNADVVISHLNEEAAHAPGVGQLSNLNDRQLQCLLNSDQSFYELFDMRPGSPFLQTFTPLANSQEKPSVALALKGSKIGFELARNVGVPDVKEMPQQHWFGVAFDLLWVWISFQAIKSTTDLPLDNQNLNRSNFLNQCLLAAMAMAFFAGVSHVRYIRRSHQSSLYADYIVLVADCLKKHFLSLW